jgi:hypothetical protein
LDFLKTIGNVMEQIMYVATMSYTYEARELNLPDLCEYAHTFLNIDEAKRYCIENIVAGWGMYLFDLSTNLNKFPKTEEYVNSHREFFLIPDRKIVFNFRSDHSDLVSSLYIDTTYDLSDLCSLINMSPAKNLGMHDNSFKDLCCASIHTIKLSIDTNVIIKADVDVDDSV